MKVFNIGGHPSAVVAVRDRIFVADDQANTVTMYSAQTGRPLAKPERVGAAPVDLDYQEVMANHGSVWVASALAGTITRLDQDTGKAHKPVPVCGTPVDLAIEAQPAAACIDDGTVALEQGRTVTHLGPLPDGASRIAWRNAYVGGSERIWVLGKTNRLLLVDPDTGEDARPAVTVEGGPIAITQVDDEAVVATFDAKRVGRVGLDGSLQDALTLRSSPVAIDSNWHIAWGLTRDNDLFRWQPRPGTSDTAVAHLPFRARALDVVRFSEDRAIRDGKHSEVWVVGVEPGSLARVRL